MKPVYVLVVLLFILVCSCSRDERPDKWVLLSKDKNNTYYYTLDRMTKTDQHLVKIWVKTVFHDMRHVGEDDIIYAKNMYMIKCDIKKYKMNVGFNYSPAHKAVSKTELDQEEGEMLVMGKPGKEAPIKTEETVQDLYHPLIPDSPADRLYGIVCH
ncbi:MAG: hypothetical protein HXX11_14230 [Desulfuromonadales bacterium]|nr:hypothetical protein [Desulfuromonadales bacterium]